MARFTGASKRKRKNSANVMSLRDVEKEFKEISNRLAKLDAYIREYDNYAHSAEKEGRYIYSPDESYYAAVEEMKPLKAKAMQLSDKIKRMKTQDAASKSFSAGTSPFASLASRRGAVVKSEEDAAWHSHRGPRDNPSASDYEALDKYVHAFLPGALRIANRGGEVTIVETLPVIVDTRTASDAMFALRKRAGTAISAHANNQYSMLVARLLSSVANLATVLSEPDATDESIAEARDIVDTILSHLHMEMMMAGEYAKRDNRRTNSSWAARRDERAEALPMTAADRAALASIAEINAEFIRGVRDNRKRR